MLFSKNHFMTNNSINWTNTKAMELLEDGLTVVPAAISHRLIDQFRDLIIDNHNLFKRTRSNPSCGHLPGFHHISQFSLLHETIASNHFVVDILAKRYPNCKFESLDLTDITINRSQEWHIDLPRGHYRHFINEDIAWDPILGGGVYKVLLYMQNGKSLKYIKGSHLKKISLVSDDQNILTESGQEKSLKCEKGSLIIMDIRLIHRGSTQSECDQIEANGNIKILASTVVGSKEHALSRQVRAGNSYRHNEWLKLHRNTAATFLPKIHKWQQ